MIYVLPSTQDFVIYATPSTNLKPNSHPNPIYSAQFQFKSWVNCNSGTAAVEVISGIPPFRLRKRELRNREYVRISSMEKNHGTINLRLY